MCFPRLWIHACIRFSIDMADGDSSCSSTFSDAEREGCNRDYIYLSIYLYHRSTNLPRGWEKFSYFAVEMEWIL
jgi:hypothetical protein